MHPARARAVLCLALFAALAALSGSIVDPPEFDLISGVEWAERVADAIPGPESAAQVASPPLGTERSASPRIASGLILLAGGLIVTVAVFGMHAQMQHDLLRATVRRH